MDLADLAALAAKDNHLAVVSTIRPDGSVHSSVVSAGVLAHPVRGVPQVAFVVQPSAKLTHLRRDPRATVVFRAGFLWGAVEGRCDLAGPDDALDGFDPAELPELLRAIFRAAGGTHDDWDTYDRVMREERRTAVLVEPERVYSNPT